ncbi:MAG: DNA gyrase subunit A [Myxococcales bacterium]|nr:MAG: DNA gyrase subunit A [Myxococcales bacterium]
MLFQPKEIPVAIEDEMKASYLEYAMSVIIARALPDVRDGLKPVHRRVLYAMHEMKNFHNQAYKKSARIVGDVIGKYHPHGDAAVYDTIVRLAQPFSLRYPLVDGQGNFGSVDGDPAAAMRYTEIRLEKIAGEMLADIDKETVDFLPNYDGSEREPVVLPNRVPNLLINGASGIAVGMSTNIPPHNLGEIVDAVAALIKKPEITIDELIRIVPGPDFPTAGFIYGREGIESAYRTGRGIVKMRARALIERNRRTDREAIIITEIPYMVNKAKLVEHIAELIRDKKLEGISDLRDESDRDGMRISIELKRDAVAGVILNNLFKLTHMQSSFGVILLALVNGQPRVLNLKEALQHFIDHRRVVVTRRSIFELKKAEDREHILVGLKTALDHIDAVIAAIRASQTIPEAKEALIKKFGLSERQAQAILDMRLQRLSGLERQKILDELETVRAEIERLKAILADEKLLMNVIVEELAAVRAAYADARRTEIVAETKELSIEDLIVEEDMVVTISHSGYIKRNAISLYRAQRRGGKGKTGMTTKAEDIVTDLFVASTHDHVLIFSDHGLVYWLKVHQIPQAGRAARGKAIVNLLNMEPNERVAAVLPVREFKAGYHIIFATKKGTVKKTELAAYSNPRSVGTRAILLDEKDELIDVKLTDGQSHILLSTRKGKAIRFKEDEVRPMGRATRGIRGVMLSQDDELVGLDVLSEGASILSVTANGYGKRSRIEDYRIQGRGGRGIITIKTTERNGDVIAVKQVMDDDDLMLVTHQGVILRMKMAGIKVIGRNTQGVRLIHLAGGDSLVNVAKLVEKEEKENGEPIDDPNGQLPLAIPPEDDPAEAEAEEETDEDAPEGET